MYRNLSISKQKYMEGPSMYFLSMITPTILALAFKVRWCNMWQLKKQRYKVQTYCVNSSMNSSLPFVYAKKKLPKNLHSNTLSLLCNFE